MESEYNKLKRILMENNLLKREDDAVILDQELYFDEIMSHIERIKKGYSSFIYFLYNSNKDLMYIGKTFNMGSRISSHRGDCINKEWKSHVKYFRYKEFESEADMHFYEVYYIIKLKPCYNKSCKTLDNLSVKLPELKLSEFINIKNGFHSSNQIYNKSDIRTDKDHPLIPKVKAWLNV